MNGQDKMILDLGFWILDFLIWDSGFSNVDLFGCS
jgi:hypothetical protein